MTLFVIQSAFLVNASTMLGFTRQAALKRLRRNITLAHVLAGDARAPVSAEDLYLYLKHVVRHRRYSPLASDWFTRNFVCRNILSKICNLFCGIRTIERGSLTYPRRCNS